MTSKPVPPPIRLAVVEDDRTTRETLVALLAGEGRFHCTGAFGSAEEAIAALPDLAPDVALVDINLPGLSGIDCVMRLKALRPTLQILMLTTYEDSDKIVQSLRAG